jgi:amino acid transporter
VLGLTFDLGTAVPRVRFAVAGYNSSSPGVIVAYTQSVGASLVVWAIAAFLSWTGASSFAELGASLPRNGGAQAYLAYTYGPLPSYLFTWTTASLLGPGE